MITEEYLSTLDAEQVIELLEKKESEGGSKEEIAFIKEYIVDTEIRQCKGCYVYFYDVDFCVSDELCDDCSYEEEEGENEGLWR